ncbi:Zn(2)-C6 fungal-type domain-containing protein [Mycena venus]|uniref:Zn(2)-C6 fungal-type domain-containing protein n=1 Tax=Mycena venus TaxID=2733690 RepID=A0A8H6Y9K4_9AGAR|nr:Zn(2)-C6 fungal-type domain-containing protein [Mycena venus]
MPRMAPSSSYVQSLETRLKTVENLLKESNIVSSSAPLDSALEDLNGTGVELITRAIRGINRPFPAPHSDDLSFLDVAESLESLSLDNPSNHGFQGKSSQAMLVKAAVDLKTQKVAAAPSATSSRTVSPPTPKPWVMKPWDNLPPDQDYNFPPHDLMMRLTSLYFTNLNVLFPVLHRPTFESALSAHTHLSDYGFARVLLLVCALGARYSNDPRVHVPAIPFGTAGWQWFDQVKLTGCGQLTLYDLQAYCLAVQFLDRTSGPRAAWTMVGFGIRLAQDIGAHRLKLRGCTISPEEEMEKRAYWTLVLFDAQLSASLGRSIAIQSHDFDLEQPSAVDDEYWSASIPPNPHGTGAFCQPANKPSLVDYFVCQLNLNRILSFTLKVFYSTNRSRSIIGVSDDSWEKLVMEFDSALNTWRDSIPGHLRWNPDRPLTDKENDNEKIFFDQSAALYCNSYLAQILIHRPFIPSVRGSEGVAFKSFPSLTICNNAARACSHVAEAHHRRRPHNPLPFAQTAIFTSGIVLLLNIWGGNRERAGGGRVRVQDAELSDVHRCINVLRAYNERWPSAGPLFIMHPRPPQSHDSPFGGSENSSGSGSGGTPSIPLQANNSSGVGVPMPLTSNSVLPWPAYDPALETLVDPEMLNHYFGPGEAPARAPQVPPSAYTAFSGGHSSSYAGSGGYYGIGNSSTDMHTDTDTVAMWSAAPSGFEVSDWDSYLSSIGT